MSLWVTGRQAKYANDIIKNMSAPGKMPTQEYYV
jgi:hypothetical protein